VTNLSWDNAAIVSGATLTKWNLEEDDIIEITVGNGRVKAPVIVAPGHPDNSITVYLGYGREVGRVAGGAGFNAYLIRNTWAPFYATGAVKKVEGKWGTAITKSHYRDQRGKTFGQQGNGNNSLEADEAIGERALFARLRSTSSRPIRTSRTRAKAARRRRTTLRSFPTGSTTRPTPGPCPST